ncbi:DUF4494 domain-containing protein [Brumimicrobium aurantiacum]|uniref:DUF4494 domain-containing protein n=1 Tax=Brumimicrobium aurantiacum TaxID=1737063 RepID=A0A3E1EYE1_9FLAO|nr:DUF4494 domain-containing protein [Brumimicrobium aurantiacum]RFC54564.1 DUF4494 domain-containing protein [Brumimicrobium aurantiacum]
MNNWFTVKVKYTKQLEDGRLKRVTEPYLVDSVSFTDAEARIYEEVGQNVTGEFLITGITKTEYADIFYYEDSDDWYKCKLTYVSIDGDEGKEKKITSNFLVTASSVKEAFERIKESLSDMTVTFEVPAISLTSIVEVLPYNPDMDVEIGRRPLEEGEELVNTPSESTYEEEELEAEEASNEEVSEESYDEEEEDVNFEDETK